MWKLYLPQSWNQNRAFVCVFSQRFRIAYKDLHDITDMHARMDMHVRTATGCFSERACDPHDNLFCVDSITLIWSIQNKFNTLHTWPSPKMTVTVMWSTQMFITTLVTYIELICVYKSSMNIGDQTLFFELSFSLSQITLTPKLSCL